MAFENPKNPVDLLDYFRKRFYRIYPAYFVAVVIYLFFQAGKIPFWIQSIFFVSHIALIHNFYEALIFQISVPMWSIATEFQLYILLPVIFIITWKLKKYIRKEILLPFLIYIAAGLIGIAFLSAATYMLTNFSIPSSVMSLDGGVIEKSPLVGLAYFCWGVLCAYIYLRIIRQLRKPNVLFDIAAGIFDHVDHRPVRSG
jgi:peptidoglycan/LPS O-acetylase OafA/YrhL